MTGLTVGLVLAGGRYWMGGLQYVTNLALALKSLPEPDRPRVVLYAQPTTPSYLLSPVESVVDRLRHARADSLWTLAKDIRYTGLRATGGQAIRQFVGTDRVDVLYPIQETLGKDYPVPWIAWIPDLQHRVLAEYFGLMNRIGREVRLRRLVRDARVVVLSSLVALDDLSRFLKGALQTKVRVLEFATYPSPEWFQADLEHVRKAYALPDRYFLVANQFWAHKNHMDVFRAVRSLKESGKPVTVVCTGSTVDPRSARWHRRLMRYVAEHRLQESIRVLGIIPRADQVAIMRAALAVVQPSRFEGWSTVVEEARALGKPLVLSRIAVHLEQAPPRAEYFPLDKPDELSGILAALWSSAQGGFQLADEQAALRAYTTRVQRFAAEFLSIAEAARDPAGTS